MKILFFTKGDAQTGSSRQRVWQLSKHLKEAYGHDYEILHSLGRSFWDISSKRFQELGYIYKKVFGKDTEVIFVHKSFFPFDVVFIIVMGKIFGGKRLIYDMDDAQWTHSRLKTIFLVYFVDSVFCGSQEICRWSSRYNINTVLIPTVIDKKLYESNKVSHAKKSVITLGWVGVGKTYFKNGHLNILKEVFEILIERDILFRFVLIGAMGDEKLKKFFTSDKYESEFIDNLDWSISGVVAKTMKEREIDIGLAPLENSEFSMAKCGFKIIEYMGVGVPVIASPVGEQGSILESVGYIAKTPEEWANAIIALKDEKKREKMGVTGLERVASSYSYESVLPKIQEILT